MVQLYHGRPASPAADSLFIEYIEQSPTGSSEHNCQRQPECEGACEQHKEITHNRLPIQRFTPRFRDKFIRLCCDSNLLMGASLFS